MVQVLWTLGMKDNKWLRLLAYVTGLVNQVLLLQNEYLAGENRILRARLSATPSFRCGEVRSVRDR